jgi:hypothetical protein
MFLRFFKVSCVSSFILWQNSFFFPLNRFTMPWFVSFVLSGLGSCWACQSESFHDFFIYIFVSCLNRITSCWCISFEFSGTVICLDESYYCSLISINLYLVYLKRFISSPVPFWIISILIWNHLIWFKCCLNRTDLHSSKIILLYMSESNHTYYDSNQVVVFTTNIALITPVHI